jgi:hypothetical protein
MAALAFVSVMCPCFVQFLVKLKLGEGTCMRSTADLIVELKTEASRRWYCALVVAFEDRTIFITAAQEKALDLLNEAVNQGGIPIGLIAADKTGNELTMQSYIFPEHGGTAREEAGNLLQRIAEQVAQRLRKERREPSLP